MCTEKPEGEKMTVNIWSRMKWSNRSGTAAGQTMCHSSRWEIQLKLSQHIYTLAQRQDAVVKGGLNEAAAES